jgi:hypothetical protein
MTQTTKSLDSCWLFALIAGACLMAGLACSVGCQSQVPQAVSLYWTTDRAVDRLDAAHMGQSLRARGSTDEERALAVWNYLRRTMYHYPMRNETNIDQFDAAKLINVYGYSFCTQQGFAAAALARAAGLESRGIGFPGHGMYEVFYDGRFHAFCTEFAFFVRTRDADRHIASMDEMKADPTLISKAREEGRASSPFLPCAGGPDILGEPEGTDLCPYSLTERFYTEDFFIKGAKEWRSQGKPDPSTYSAWVPLRRGESLRLDWAASGKFVPPCLFSTGPIMRPERFWPPRHICGEKDRSNPFFAEVAPYEQVINGRKTYRYYGSGLQTWRPRLDAVGAIGDLAAATNLAVKHNALLPATAGQPAVAEFEMTGPYPYVGGLVRGKARLGNGAGDSLKLLVRGASADAPWKLIYHAAPGERDFSVALGDTVLPPSRKDPAHPDRLTPYRFCVRVEQAGQAELIAPEIQAAVQHNWAALPQLVPGANRVQLRTHENVDPGATFDLAWEESGRKTDVHRPMVAGRTEFTIDVRASDPPRMLYALLSRD